MVRVRNVSKSECVKRNHSWFFVLFIGKKSIRHQEDTETRSENEVKVVTTGTTIAEATVAANIPGEIHASGGHTSLIRRQVLRCRIRGEMVVRKTRSLPEMSNNLCNILDNADMEISPDSTPTSEPSYASPSANINNANVAEDPLANTTSPNGHVPSKHHHNNQSSTSGKQNSKQNSTTATSASPSTHHNNYHSSHHHRHRSVSPNNDAINDVNNSNSIRNSPAYGNNSLAGANNHHLIGDGPPTPEMDLNSGGDHRRSELSYSFLEKLLSIFYVLVDGVTGGVSSLQSVMSATTLSNRLHLLTPSLAKFFRVDLLSHVTNWPSELLEKQVIKSFPGGCKTKLNFSEFFRLKSALRKFICWAISNAAGFQRRFNARGVLLG